MLIVFGGLPGVGKTTIARAISRALKAVYVRVDSIEQALRAEGAKVWTEGYAAAYAVAGDNLALGRVVLADCVNPLSATRDAWVAVAAKAGARLVEVELLCTDVREHRRRVEARMADIPGHVVPDWDSVLAHEYEPWGRPRVVMDTAGRIEADVVREVLARII